MPVGAGMLYNRRRQTESVVLLDKFKGPPSKIEKKTSEIQEKIEISRNLRKLSISGHRNGQKGLKNLYCEYTNIGQE